MNLPRGMTVAWQATTQHDISRVASLSLGGLFIEATDPAPIGETLQVQFDIPGGIRFAPEPWYVDHLTAKAWASNSPNCRPRPEPDWIACFKNCLAPFALRSSDAGLGWCLREVASRLTGFVARALLQSVIDSASFGIEFADLDDLP